MRQKRGKTSVIGFRAGRLLEDILDTSGLSIAYLVETGLAAHCKIPGAKTEMIINGAIGIIDKQMADLQGRKDELLKIKSAITPSESQKTNSAMKQKERAVVLVKGRSGALYWTTDTMVNENPEILIRVNSDDVTGDELIIRASEDIPQCELSEV